MQVTSARAINGPTLKAVPGLHSVPSSLPPGGISMRPYALISVGLLLGCTDTPTELSREAPSFAVANSWTTRAPMPQELRQHAVGMVPAANGDQIIYVIGGVACFTCNRPEVYAYNPRTNAWTQKASLPRQRRDMNGAVQIGSKLYVSGGYWGGGHLSDLLVYNPATNKWIAKRPMPNKVSRGSSAQVGGKLYVLYGECADCSSPGPSKRMWRYDPATDSWTRMRDAPRFHVNAASGVINGKWYVVGGGNGDRILDVYDPKANTWTQKASMPASHAGAAGAVLSQKLYVIGGQNTVSPHQPLNIVHAYNPLTNTWAAKAPMPTPRSALGAAKAVRSGNAVLYALGGENGSLSESGEGPIRINEEYDD